MSKDIKTAPSSSPKKKNGKKDKGEQGDTATKFQGDGLLFKAKMYGTVDVQSARGDAMCQQAMQSLKSAIKGNSYHKQKIIIKINLNGVVLIDATNSKQIVKHKVNRISFISKDPSDNRSFSYIVGSGDDKHVLYGIKTDKPAETVLLTFRDLFQTVSQQQQRESLQKRSSRSSSVSNESNSQASVVSDSNISKDASTLPLNIPVDESIPLSSPPNNEDTSPTDNLTAPPSSVFEVEQTSNPFYTNNPVDTNTSDAVNETDSDQEVLNSPGGEATKEPEAQSSLALVTAAPEFQRNNAQSTPVAQSLPTKSETPSVEANLTTDQSGITLLNSAEQLHPPQPTPKAQDSQDQPETSVHTETNLTTQMEVGAFGEPQSSPTTGRLETKLDQVKFTGKGDEFDLFADRDVSSVQLKDHSATIDPFTTHQKDDNFQDTNGTSAPGNSGPASDSSSTNHKPADSMEVRDKMDFGTANNEISFSAGETGQFINDKSNVQSHFSDDFGAIAAGTTDPWGTELNVNVESSNPWATFEDSKGENAVDKAGSDDPWADSPFAPMNEAKHDKNSVEVDPINNLENSNGLLPAHIDNDASVFGESFSTMFPEVSSDPFHAIDDLFSSLPNAEQTASLSSEPSAANTESTNVNLQSEASELEQNASLSEHISTNSPVTSIIDITAETSGSKTDVEFEKTESNSDEQSSPNFAPPSCPAPSLPLEVLATIVHEDDSSIISPPSNQKRGPPPTIPARRPTSQTPNLPPVPARNFERKTQSVTSDDAVDGELCLSPVPSFPPPQLPQNVPGTSPPKIPSRRPHKTSESDNPLH